MLTDLKKNNNMVFISILHLLFHQIQITQVSYRILGRGYFSTTLVAENKYTEIEGRGSHLK